MPKGLGTFPRMKPKSIAVLLITLAFVGCKKEPIATAPPAKSSESIEIDRERLKIEKETLYQHKKEEIEREYDKEIARENAVSKETTDRYIKMLDDGLLTKVQVEKHLAEQAKIREMEHKMASDLAMQKLNALKKE